MKRYGATSNSATGSFGRLDAGFMLLAEHNRELVLELLDKFNREQLLDIARLLPFDQEVAQVVHPGQSIPTESKFFKYLENAQMNIVAVYCAAAVQDARAAVAAEISEMKNLIKIRMNKVNTIANLAHERGADKLYKLIKACK